MDLKESKKHLQAFEYAEKNYNFDSMEALFHNLLYLCRLSKLDPKAVNVDFPGLDNEESGTFLCYLWPYEPDEEGEDHDLLPDIIEIRHHVAYNQRQSAKFCKVTERTLQRWVKKGGLESIKLGKNRVFKESDLQEFMELRLVGGEIKLRLNTNLNNLTKL